MCRGLRHSLRYNMSNEDESSGCDKATEPYIQTMVANCVDVVFVSSVPY